MRQSGTIIRPIGELASRLEALATQRGRLVVGIDGRGGSGKSTFARALGRQLSASTVIEFDDFYRPSGSRLPAGQPDIGGNFEWRRLRDQVLLPLSQGRRGRYQRYDWTLDAMAEWHDVPAAGVIVIEGNYSTRQAIRDFYGFRIWFEAPHALRLARGVGRGHENEAKWLNEWMPEEERYLAAEEPRRFAQLVVDGSAAVDPEVAFAQLQ